MVDVIIPVYKPGKETYNLINGLKRQTYPVGKIIIINTEKMYFDRFVEEYDVDINDSIFDIHHIMKSEFDHGKTRNMGAELATSKYFVCMTQDAEPVDDNLLEELIRPLEQIGIAASYGRQMARETSTIAERLTRQFNYPEHSLVKSKGDIDTLGIKTFFCSNVCCAYNKEIFSKLGGFINHTNFNEDMIYAAKAIEAGYKIAYSCDAKVYHSHNYTAAMQFHRNVDIGISQADHPEVFANVSSESEGKKLVISIIKQMIKERKYWEIITFIFASGCKYVGYKIGKNYKKLPRGLVIACAMNKEYFKS